MWQLIVGGILGFGASELLGRDEKQKDKDTIKEFRERISELEEFRPYQEKIKDDINHEGFDYSFRGYSSYDKVDSKKFHTLRKKYVTDANAIENYIDKTDDDLYDEKYEIGVQDAIDKEGFDNALLTYHDWKDIKDKKYQTLLKNYKKSAKALAKHLNYEIT